MSEIQTNSQENKEIDLLDQIANGTRKMDDLTAEEIDTYLSSNYDKDNTIEPEQRIIEESPSQIPEKDVSSEKQPDNLIDIKQKLWEAQNTANQYKQKYEAATKRYKDPEERLRSFDEKFNRKPELKVSDTNQPELDVYSESYLKKISELEARLQQREDREKEIIETLRQREQREIEVERFNAENEQVQILQEEFPELKTSKPYYQVESEYNNWYNTLGGDKVQKYFADPEFKRQLDSQGYSVPQDYDKYAALWNVKENFKKGGYANLKIALKDSVYYDEIMMNRYSKKQQPKTETNYAAVDKLSAIAKQKETVPIMGSPESNVAITGGGQWSEATIEKELIRLNSKPQSRWTADDKAIFKKLEDHFGID